MKKYLIFLIILLIILVGFWLTKERVEKKPTVVIEPGSELQTTKLSKRRAADLCRVWRVAAARVPHFRWSLELVGATPDEIDYLVNKREAVAKEFCSYMEKRTGVNPRAAKMGSVIQEINQRYAKSNNIRLPQAAKLVNSVLATQVAAYGKNCASPGAVGYAKMTERAFNIYLNKQAKGECISREGAVPSAGGGSGDGNITLGWNPVMRASNLSASNVREKAQECYQQMVDQMIPPDECDNPLAADGDGGDDAGDDAGDDDGDDDGDGCDDPNGCDTNNDDCIVYGQNCGDIPPADSDDDSGCTDPKGCGTNNDDCIVYGQNCGSEDNEEQGTNTNTPNCVVWGNCGPQDVPSSLNATERFMNAMGLGFPSTRYGRRDNECFGFKTDGGIFAYRVDDFTTQRLDKLPPDPLGAFNQCLCQATAGQYAGLACPSEEDQERMRCIQNPWGPDDAPKKVCFDLLKRDNNEEAKKEAEKLQCQFINCGPDAFLTASKIGDFCACTSLADIEFGLPNPDCRDIDCGPDKQCGFLPNGGVGCSNFGAQFEPGPGIPGSPLGPSFQRKPIGTGAPSTLGGPVNP